MNIEKYFESLTSEMEGLKNRVRNFIDDNHWLTDGEWKESVIRTFLKRSLPDSIKVGRGFVMTNDGPTNQIDILLYKSTSPVFFRDGDLVFLPPETVLGIIEVKSKLTSRIFEEAIEKLSMIGNKIFNTSKEIDTREAWNRGYNNVQFLLGLFAFETCVNNDVILNKLRDVNSRTHQVINLISHGNSSFVKYWDVRPDDIRINYNKWHSYKLERKAPGYFIHNVLLFLSPEVISSNTHLWFPTNSKEIEKEGEIESEHQNHKRSSEFFE